MKTITEFSGILLQQAAGAQQAFLAAHPPVEEPAAEPPPAAEPTAEVAPAADTPEEAAAQPQSEEASAAQEVAPTEPETGSEPAGDPASEPAAETAAPDLGTGPEAEAVGAATGIQGDRLSRLMEALAVVGKRAAGVRLVRVLSGDKPPANAQKKGEFYYVVDMMPRPESRRDADFRGRDRDGRDRDGRGGGGRGRGPGGPGGGGGRGPGGPGGGGRGGPGGSTGFGGRGGGFSALGRDADLPRGELAKGGEGWMLTRAPEERRGGNREQVDPTRREQPARPPRAPRFDGRGPRPSGDRPAGDRSPGGRPPRGDRPPMGDRPPSGERPRFGGRPRDPAGGDGVRAQAPGPGNQAARAPGPGGPPHPRRNGGDDQRRGQGWSGPVRRRGGWDEPMVVETSPAADTVPPPPQVETAPAVESAEGEKK
jgi:hypothetical protein